MTITATIISDDPQPGTDRRNAVIEFSDDVDGSVETVLVSRPLSEDLQAWADALASKKEQTKAEFELAANFEAVRSGASTLTVPLLRNTTAVWEEYVFKGMSNLKWGPSVADFAHVFTESQANNRAAAATGLTMQQVNAWSGDAQPVAIGRSNYESGHPNEPGELYFFDGFPTE